MIFDVAIYVETGASAALTQNLKGVGVTWEPYSRTAMACDPITGKELAKLVTWKDNPFEITHNSIRLDSASLPEKVDGSRAGYWVLTHSLARQEKRGFDWVAVLMFIISALSTIYVLRLFHQAR